MRTSKQENRKSPRITESHHGIDATSFNDPGLIDLKRCLDSCRNRTIWRIELANRLGTQSIVAFERLVRRRSSHFYCRGHISAGESLFGEETQKKGGSRGVCRLCRVNYRKLRKKLCKFLLTSISVLVFIQNSMKEVNCRRDTNRQHREATFFGEVYQLRARGLPSAPVNQVLKPKIYRSTLISFRRKPYPSTAEKNEEKNVRVSEAANKLNYQLVRKISRNYLPKLSNESRASQVFFASRLVLENAKTFARGSRRKP